MNDWREALANLILLDLVHDRERDGFPKDAFEVADAILSSQVLRDIAAAHYRGKHWTLTEFAEYEKIADEVLAEIEKGDGTFRAGWNAAMAHLGAFQDFDYEYAVDDDPEGRTHGWFRRLVGPWKKV